MRDELEKELMRILASDIKQYCKGNKQCTEECAFYRRKNAWGYECALQNDSPECWEV